MSKLFLYIICTLLSGFTLSGINYNGFFKKNHLWEARIFTMIISLIMGYLLASFLMAFMDASRLI